MISAAPSLPNNQEPTWAVEAKIEDLPPCSFLYRCIYPSTSNLRPIQFIQTMSREGRQGEKQTGIKFPE